MNNKPMRISQESAMQYAQTIVTVRNRVLLAIDHIAANNVGLANAELLAAVTELHGI